MSSPSSLSLQQPLRTPSRSPSPSPQPSDAQFDPLDRPSEEDEDSDGSVSRLLRQEDDDDSDSDDDSIFDAEVELKVGVVNASNYSQPYCRAGTSMLYDNGGASGSISQGVPETRSGSGVVPQLATQTG
ncbi:hypothetical protein GMOD_00002732 [Pyrenophora seminiperda CCB06]|uniref:Uncharacterized protein n=1 Tax=Pyrenophora seminiperda CCB06 TaxID=1302712 RepID=A0A3M7M2Z8_9PLEO|nr:hypothetical protein GMOD_00002732 [Pyrenophora seminiperda CCB06]